MQGFLAGAPQEPKLVEQQQEMAPQPDARLVASYQEFQHALRLSRDEIKTIYHPACGTDISPSVAFPDSQVVYVDHMPSAVQNLTKHGYDAHCDNANTFTLPQPADVLIIINADHEFSPAHPLQQVRHGGYVLCNSYNQDAYKVSQQEGVQCLGRIEERVDNGKTQYVFNPSTAEIQAYFAHKQAEYAKVLAMTPEEAANYFPDQSTLSGVVVFKVEHQG